MTNQNLLAKLDKKITRDPDGCWRWWGPLRVVSGNRYPCHSGRNVIQLLWRCLKLSPVKNLKRTCAEELCVNPDHYRAPVLRVHIIAPVEVDDEDRFNWYADTSGGPQSCWPWLGSISVDTGYGQGRYNKRPMGAHRVSWLLHRGDIPKATPYVLHSCDRTDCVNPTHLWVGTQKQNLDDMRMKGRERTRTASWGRPYRFSLADYARMRELNAQNVPQWRIASMFGTSRIYVNRIIKGHVGFSTRRRTRELRTPLSPSITNEAVNE